VDREQLLSDIRARIRQRDAAAVAKLAPRMSPADWSDIIPDLDLREAAILLQWLPDDEVPDVLAALEPGDAARILGTLTRPVAADLLEVIHPDDSTDIINELGAEDADAILSAMEPTEADEIRLLLGYPPDSAGGRMTPAFVAVRPDLRADQAVVALRQVAQEAETVNYVYVTADDGTLLGVLSLHNLVLTAPETPVSELMVTDIIRIPANADQEVAARLLADWNLLALPVVDPEERLVGILTEDDVSDILEQEATEDFERMGGSQPLDVPYMRAGVLLLVRRRIFWLLLLFVAEAYTGTILRAFEGELQQVIALTFFIPLLIGTGGNVGSQTTTTLVRAIAVGEVGLRNLLTVMRKEVTVGVILGAVMALIAFGRAEILGVSSDVSLVVALTIAVITVWAAAVASVLPLVLRRFKVDPAVVSAPFITTLVDGTGLLIYFSIAKVILGL
jgi:magnesium transporter